MGTFRASSCCMASCFGSKPIFHQPLEAHLCLKSDGYCRYTGPDEVTRGHETPSRPSVASTFMYRCGSGMATALELKVDIGQCEHCFVIQEWPGGLSLLTASIGVNRGS